MGWMGRSGTEADGGFGHWVETCKGEVYGLTLSVVTL